MAQPYRTEHVAGLPDVDAVLRWIADTYGRSFRGEHVVSVTLESVGGGRDGVGAVWTVRLCALPVR